MLTKQLQQLSAAVALPKNEQIPRVCHFPPHLNSNLGIPDDISHVWTTKKRFSIFSPVFMDGPATHSVTEDIYEAEAAVAASAAAVERLASQVHNFFHGGQFFKNSLGI